ncbi:unnamed protein product [marine sediment metagenome]|uniref:Uncharacterized protein n=1 Tax=marine sediment metagenome TaxID=412755 RepID=X0WJB3_9ZZZZ
MAESRRITKVNVEETVKFGQFANAFRVVEEVGPDCFLDFMVYSAAEKEATVVSRVRVRREFLPSIRETLSEAIEEFPAESAEEAPQEAPLRKNGETVH